MRVLHIIPNFAPTWRYGGPVVAADGLTRTLAKLGHEVTVFTTNIDGDGILDVPTARPVNRDGVRVWYFPVQRPRWYFFSRQLAQAIRDGVGDFEIVHIHMLFLWPTTVGSFCAGRGGSLTLFTPLDCLIPRASEKRMNGEASLSPVE